MNNIFNYIFRGMVHYFYVLFNFFDFFDIATMFLICILLLLFSILIKNFRSAIFSLIATLKKVVLTFPGFILFMIFASYYSFVLFFFEDINLVFLLLTIYLIIKDYIDVNQNLLANSKEKVSDSIKGTSITILLIFLQQVVSMFENNNFENTKCAFISLIAIPVYILVFIFFNFFSEYNNYYQQRKGIISIDDYEFFKLYIYCFFKCKKFDTVHANLDKLLSSNYGTYLDYKIVLKELLVSIKTGMKIKKNIKVFNSRKKRFYFTHLNLFWVVNVFVVIISVILKRFLHIDYTDIYYICFGLLIILLWVDLVKINDINSQYSFIIYSFIDIIVVLLMLINNFRLSQNRLSEFGFLIPVFIYFKFKSRGKKMSFLSLPSGF